LSNDRRKWTYGREAKERAALGGTASDSPTHLWPPQHT
jgi:hypothetical protein